MHQFLEQLLTSPPNKRKTQTQNNCDILKNFSEKQRLKQQFQVERQNSQPYFQQNKDQEYEVEQIEEQIVFERGLSSGAKLNLRNSDSDYNKAILGLQSISQHKETAGIFYRSEFKADQNSKQNECQQIKNSNQGHGVEDSGIGQQNPLIEAHLEDQQLGGLLDDKRSVEKLIGAINNAKQYRFEMVDWMMGEKQRFGCFMETAFKMLQQQIQLTVLKQFQQKKQAIYFEVRQQIQVQYMQKLSLSRQKTSHAQETESKRQLAAGESGMQRKWQIEKRLIKQQLEQRYRFRIERLEQEVQEQRKYSQQLIRTYQWNKTTRESMCSNSNQQCLEETEFVKKQLQDKERTISQLEMQIQRLNEHVFDLEQQIQGIELEVENRLRQRLTHLENQSLSHPSHLNYQSSHQPQIAPILQGPSHLQHSSPLYGYQQSGRFSDNPTIQHQLQQIAQLQLQNEHFKQILQQMNQQQMTSQLQIKEQQKIIIFREQQVKKNEEDIGYEWTEIQSERQALLNRQLQLTTAEQNISQKISQIRTKQSQFQKWQTQLEKRELALNFREQQINKKLQDIVQNQNLNKQKYATLQRQNVPTLSGNNRSRKLIHEFNSGEGGGSFRPNDVEVPQLPIGKKNQEMHEAKHDKSFDKKYQFNNRPYDVMSRANFEISFEEAERSYNRQNISKQRMAITGTNFRSNRISNNVHNYVLPQTSKAQRKSRSKSTSKQKLMLKSNFNSGSVASNYKNQSYKTKYSDELYHSKQASNLNGLGSKLQRLRDQIKRQIDSIK